MVRELGSQELFWTLGQNLLTRQRKVRRSREKGPLRRLFRGFCDFQSQEPKTQNPAGRGVQRIFETGVSPVSEFGVAGQDTPLC